MHLSCLDLCSGMLCCSLMLKRQQLAPEIAKWKAWEASRHLHTLQELRLQTLKHAEQGNSVAMLQSQVSSRTAAASTGMTCRNLQSCCVNSCKGKCLRSCKLPSSTSLCLGSRMACSSKAAHTDGCLALVLQMSLRTCASPKTRLSGCEKALFALREHQIFFFG